MAILLAATALPQVGESEGGRCCCRPCKIEEI